MKGQGFSFQVPTTTLPETNIFAPKNGWLEYDPFLLGFGLFSGAFAVSFREGNLYGPPRLNEGFT